MVSLWRGRDWLSMCHFRCCSQLFSPPADLWVSDEGTYVCEAENQFGRIQSRPAMVTVTGLGKSMAEGAAAVWAADRGLWPYMLTYLSAVFMCHPYRLN